MEEHVQAFWAEFAKKYREATLKDVRNEEELLRLAKEVVEKAEANAAENPKTEEVLIVVVEPKKLPYKKVISNDLDSMKAIVGGWIEHVSIAERPNGSRIGIILNEEGKLIGLPPNRILNFRNGSDVYVGTFFITAHNLEGDTISLTEQEAADYISRFSHTTVNL
jgi:hypothetical protein